MNAEERTNDWQFWVIMVVVCMAIAVGLPAFHRFTNLGRSLSVDGLAMIGTTLIAAATGFLAILYQVRSSSKQLRDQIRIERDSEREERERRQKSIASALIAEINDFYQFGAKGLHDRMRLWLPQGDASNVTTFPELGALPPAATIYHSVASEVGSFSPNVVKSLVGLYNYLDNFVDLYDSYRTAWRSSNGTRVDRTLFQDIWDNLPKLFLNSYQTCELLAAEHGIKFDKSEFIIGGLDSSTKQRLQEENAKIVNRLNQDLKCGTDRLDG